MSKIKTIQELKEELEKRKDKTIVTTNGTFDILHAAHIKILEKAKSFGDILIVLVNSDSSVKKFKGPSRPIIPEQERAYILSSLSCIDYVCIFPQDTPLEYLSIIKPRFHVKGGTYILEKIKAEEELLTTWGGQFKAFKSEEGYSTTNIIQKILDNNKD